MFLSISELLIPIIGDKARVLSAKILCVRQYCKAVMKSLRQVS